MKLRLVLILSAALAGCVDGSDEAQPDSGSTLDRPDLAAGPCEYPQETPAGAANDPRCPSQYGGSAGSLCFNQPCPEVGLTCRYYGVGDGRPGCYAIAMMWCYAKTDHDAGASLASAWICAN